MTRNNLEKNIRDKMKDRELKPSADAWSKLEAQLDATPRKRNHVFWYYAAASVVGLMLIGSVLYYQNDGDANSQFVEENVKESPIDQEINVLPEIVVDKEIAVEENSKNPEENAVLPEKKINLSTNTVESEKERKDARTIANSDEEKFKEEIETTDFKENYLDQKAQEVASDIRNLQENKGDVTMEEVEDLLENARREIFLNRTIKESQISAATLLNEVEWELDKTFSDKVFDALGEGFKIIATAYTERNR